MLYLQKVLLMHLKKYVFYIKYKSNLLLRSPLNMNYSTGHYYRQLNDGINKLNAYLHEAGDECIIYKMVMRYSSYRS